MKYFINLTSHIINKLHIIEIIKKPSKYYIHMSNNSIEGYILFFSRISTNHNIIEICEKNNKQDYDTITDVFTEINREHLKG